MTMPYDEYVADVLAQIDRLERQLGSLSRRELQECLEDAWMAGLMHAHKLIDEVKK